MVADDEHSDVHFLQSNISLYEDSSLIDSGTLKISEECFSWEGVSKQFFIPYSQITLHAIAKNTVDQTGDQPNNLFPYPHLLVMVDGDRVWDPNSASNLSNVKLEDEQDGMIVDEADSSEVENSDSDRASDCPGSTSVLRLVPQNSEQLEDMYKALAECQALNPDPEDDNSDLDGFGDDEHDVNGQNTEFGNHTNNNGTFGDPDQFADA
ncbi:Methylosome subunit pICln isoform 1 [Schistosoma japonicum]|uniref:Chloride channel, nucleotide-sensitive, 1A n=2 Tax=Schistosoma japonicum TaxID=6182 RepID=C1L5X9_SCHJA|nr:chloride channel [Schistosoma japonicum]KAH8869248.1 chloride channel [Schistosoma japonicum]TNN10140.1 Methylosome subunit pICln isoform 1 [Schistosoma japonicum]CAX70107.1 chloride channel, nucleotide-sensitive, 1A [Schistosoma japonicum]CAX74474.1 chloride channel, nucleotide-sensitive, 1A [Schistosoma japonicum]